MARNKTDRTDKTPAATLEPTSREEIEATLDKTVLFIMKAIGNKKAVPGWHLLWPAGVMRIKIGEAEILTLTEVQASYLVKLAKENPHAFDAACYLAGQHFVVGHLSEIDTPISLRKFGASVLCGEIKRPVQRGRPRADDVLLRLWQYGLCLQTAKSAPLPLTRNRSPSGPESFSACDAVAEAFTRAGHPVTQAQLASLCYDTAHADIRALSEALEI